GRRRGSLTPSESFTLVEGLARLPQQLQDTLLGTRQLIANLARRHRETHEVLYLGRGVSFPIALEGALKLKEIAYVHAQGYAAGEMKHGPIALVDSHVLAILLVPQGSSYARTVGNLEEVRAREAQILAVATEGDEDVRRLQVDMVEIPPVAEEFQP